MDLKDIAAVSGKSGLFKVLKPTRTGVILEAIDAGKAKLIANANSRVSLLKEISVYTTGKEASLPLEDVFKNIHEKYGKNLNVDTKSSDTDLRSFLATVVPDFDTEKVYNSDIRKIVNWYSILLEHFPGVFEKKAVTEPEKKEAKKETVKETPKKEAKAAKEEKSEKKVGKKEEEKEKPKAKSTAKKK